MTTLVLDTGALIALDRNDRTVWAMLRNAADDSAQVSVAAGVIAQAWRDGSRQALLARALTLCDEVPLEGALARATGLLCGRASDRQRSVRLRLPSTRLGPRCGATVPSSGVVTMRGDLCGTA